jgi:hypothetical protein
MDEQLELPFSLQRKQVLRLLQTATTHEKHLLRVLDDHIGNRASWDCYLSTETICAEMCCRKRQRNGQSPDARRPDGFSFSPDQTSVAGATSTGYAAPKCGKQSD